MRKIAMVIGILSVLATGAQAGYWTDYDYGLTGNGYSIYTPTYDIRMGGWY